MQKTVIRIAGIEIPAIVRHEHGGYLECETVIPVEVGGVVIYPGALIKVQSDKMIEQNKKSYAIINQKS